MKQEETEEIYLAGGCLWGVQEFVRHLPGVVETEAGRANGTSASLGEPYDGYAECVRTCFAPEIVSVSELIDYLFEIIDPHSINQQGPDVGLKYRTGIYSRDPAHLNEARAHLALKPNSKWIALEVLPLSNYLRSHAAHQDRLTRFPEEYCHLPQRFLRKYRNKGAPASEREPNDDPTSNRKFNISNL